MSFGHIIVSPHTGQCYEFVALQPPGATNGRSRFRPDPSAAADHD